MKGEATACSSENRLPRAPPSSTTSKRAEMGRWKEALKVFRAEKTDSSSTLLGWPR